MGAARASAAHGRDDLLRLEAAAIGAPPFAGCRPMMPDTPSISLLINTRIVGSPWRLVPQPHRMTAPPSPRVVAFLYVLARRQVT
ncbi:MAG: hypothetical protein ACO1SX_02535 [Actinomycetota bacterium]